MAGMNSILKIFLPRDRVFYQLFENVSTVLVKMGSKLKELVNEPDFDKRGQLIQEMEDMEHQNDDYTHIIRVNPVKIYFFSRSIHIISNIIQRSS